MTTHPMKRLQSNKVLRDRGIKVIAAGFPELTPLHQGVRGQLVEYWKANWQSVANLTEATAAAEAMQIYTQARVLAQTEMAGTLKKIIDMEANSKSVIATPCDAGAGYCGSRSQNPRSAIKRYH